MGVLGTVACIVDVGMGASRSLGVVCACWKMPCSPRILITLREDTTVRVLVMRAPVICLRSCLTPSLKRHFPSIGASLNQEGSTPTPPRRRASRRVHLRECLFLHIACPISIDVAFVRPREMAHGNPANSSPWTGTLLAPFARRRYRTVDDPYRQWPGLGPTEAEDFVRYKSDRSDKEHETSDEEDQEEDQSSQASNDDEEEEEAEAAEKDSDDSGDHANKEDASLHVKSRSTYPVDDDDQSTADDDFIVVKEDSTPQSAIAAWNRNFSGNLQLELTREDPLPFTIGQRLGGGGVGVVHETHIDGVPLALKRTYTRRISCQQLNEIKILGRISKYRHRHVVELIGSYLHEQRRGFEIGMLIWPVARTDLAALLHDFGVLRQYYRDHLEIFGFPQLPQQVETIRAAIEPLLILIPPDDLGPDLPLRHEVEEVLFLCGDRIRRSLGCIANAVAYLHGQDIRHKDLKPSQILLSPQGLWLADFGWSADMSEHDTSTTSGGEMMTTKYQAPERANRERCGRSEDIFSLGCIFLEMAYCMTPVARETPRPWLQRGWSFQANLDCIQDWMEPLDKIFWKGQSPKGASPRVIITIKFPQLLMPMLAHASNDRPSIQVVLHALSVARFPGHCNSMFIAECCRPHTHSESV